MPPVPPDHERSCCITAVCVNESKALTLWLSQMTTKNRRSIQKREIEMTGSKREAILSEL
jgi:hypothetical protein